MIQFYCFKYFVFCFTQRLTRLTKINKITSVPEIWRTCTSRYSWIFSLILYRIIRILKNLVSIDKCVLLFTHTFQFLINVLFLLGFFFSRKYNSSRAVNHFKSSFDILNAVFLDSAHFNYDATKNDYFSNF